MSQSVVDICNSALLQVGAASILSLADNSREARACSIAYDGNRRDELRKHYWNFAMKRVVLAADATAPAFDYAYAFTLPPDCLRIQLPNDAGLDWNLEGRKILTNSLVSPFNSSPGGTSGSSTPQAAILRLRYVADITDATIFDPSFYNVLALSLAIDLCEALTQSNTKKQDLRMAYRDAVTEARLADAFESLPQDAPADGWILARY